jgi:hypothetical protein
MSSTARARQHEIPTHLNVQDKLLLGLTMRQFLYLLVGCSIAYSVWEQMAVAPSPVRIGLSTLCLLIAAALALVQPFGRPLEEWLLAGLVYASRPRTSTWQPIEPIVEDWRPATAGWQELAPDLVWAEDEPR